MPYHTDPMNRSQVIFIITRAIPVANNVVRCSPSVPTLPWKDSAVVQVATLLTASYVDSSPEVRKMLQQGWDVELKDTWHDSEAISLFARQDELLFLRSANRHTTLCSKQQPLTSLSNIRIP